MDQKLARTKPLAGGVACKAIHIPAPGLEGRTFQFWDLNRWVFNFCFPNIPLQGSAWEPIANTTLSSKE